MSGMTDATNRRADLFTMLRRADQSWCRHRADDPADPDYLRHLAAAGQPLVDQTASTIGEQHVVPAELARQQLTEQRAQLAAQLGRLVDAISTVWDPDGDITAQVDHAVALVVAASDQLNARHAVGEHIHQYLRDPSTGRVRPCGCGHRLPGEAKAGLNTAMTRNDAA